MWVMIYGGRLPFVDPNGVLPSLTPAQVFDPTAGIYVRLADKPQGPWSAPRTIFNPFTSTFGYCELMYFSDASGFLHTKHTQFFNDGMEKECPVDGATRTAQAWWQSFNLPLEQDPDKLRNAFGAEYGAAVLPQLIAPTPAGGVRFQWLLSTWIPYRVVVMETELGPGP